MQRIDAFGMEFAEEDLLPLARGWCAREAGRRHRSAAELASPPLPGRIKPTALLSFLSAAASSSRCSCCSHSQPQSCGATAALLPGRIVDRCLSDLAHLASMAASSAAR